MKSLYQIVAAVLSISFGAFFVWATVRIINNWHKPRVASPAVVVGACLYLPFSLCILMPNGYDPNWTSWFKIWPILPGSVPAGFLFHPGNDALEYCAAAVSTLVLMVALTWLGNRGRKGLIAAAVIALLISVPTAYFVHSAYWF
jgi:hypothetical protein